MNARHHTCWYEPEEDPKALHRLLAWTLSHKAVTAVLPPGSLPLLDIIAPMAWTSAADKLVVTPGDVEAMTERYRGVTPIFHNKDESGTKVST